MLDKKKTYLLVVAGLIVTALRWLEIISPEVSDNLLLALGFGTAAALRSGVKKDTAALRSFLLFGLLFLLPAVSFAQLVGTERTQKNVWLPSDKKILFGDYPNASINYTGGNLVIDVTHGGGKVSFPDGVDLGASNQSLGSSVIFEGATADAFETTLTVVDPTADRTCTIPNQSGAVILSAGGVADSANAISGGTGTLVFEGATADGFETTLSVTDPTADRAVVVPDAGGTVLLGGNTTVSSGANTACNTTCGSASKCIAGQDTGASGVLVACSNAAADVCLCSAN